MIRQIRLAINSVLILVSLLTETLTELFDNPAEHKKLKIMPENWVKELPGQKPVKNI